MVEDDMRLSDTQIKTLRETVANGRTLGPARTVRALVRKGLMRYEPEGAVRWAAVTREGRKALKEVTKPTQAERDECQVCERHQALRDGQLVNHGYQRPGWGWLVGGCAGVGHAPYPATTALVPWLQRVEARAEQVRELIAGLPTLTEFVAYEPNRKKWVGRRNPLEPVTYTQPAQSREYYESLDWDRDSEEKLALCRAWDRWDQALKFRERRLSQEGVQLQQEAARVRARIEAAQALQKATS